MPKVDVSGWSCDERNRQACRNPHGCHCREITALKHSNESRLWVAHAKAVGWNDAIKCAAELVRGDKALHEAVSALDRSMLAIDDPL